MIRRRYANDLDRSIDRPTDRSIDRSIAQDELDEPGFGTHAELAATMTREAEAAAAAEGAKYRVGHGQACNGM